MVIRVGWLQMDPAAAGDLRYAVVQKQRMESAPDGSKISQAFSYPRVGLAGPGCRLLTMTLEQCRQQSSMWQSWQTHCVSTYHGELKFDLLQQDMHLTQVIEHQRQLVRLL